MALNNKTATFMGIAALVLWSTIFAVIRSLTQSLGPLTASAAMYLISGVLGIAWAMYNARTLNLLPRFSLRYLLVCGSTFVAYMVALQLALGLASSSRQTMEVTLINYLWPTITIALLIPVQKYRATWLLAPGMFTATAGIFLIVSAGGGVSLGQFVSSLLHAPVVYIFAFVSAISWGLYSNFTARLASQARANPVGLFMLVAGLIFTVMAAFSREHAALTPRSSLELLYVSIFPGLLAYVFWSIAMVRANVILVTTLSYFAPLASVIVLALYLHTAPDSRIWLACLLIIAGAFICKYSLKEPGPATRA